ncbi:MAG: acyl--CoA ligase [Planctomycetes bacterium]|nr:acyl--CoA ligase [Planctomycetota bacterium]
MRYPDKAASVCQDGEMTYSELEKLSSILACALMERGIHKGDRVAILIENSHEYIISFFGVLKARAVTVPIETQIVSRELVFHLEDCTSTIILTDYNHYSLIKDALQNLASPPSVMIVDRSSLITTNAGDRSTELLDAHCTSDDVACILYTSGTTGKPKGVMLSHANLVTNANSIVEYLNLTSDDRVMVVLSFSHSYGLSLLTTCMKTGGTLVIDNRFAYPNVILQTMSTKKVTGFAGVPSHYAMLLRKSALRKHELPELKYVTQAGGALPPAMIQEFTDIFPNVKFYVMYGQTEASARLSYLEPELLHKKMGSIGKGIPGVILDVLDENGQKVSPEKTGEIVAQGTNVMLGYWNSPQETASILRNGKLYTGDLATVDVDGFIYVVGRSKEMIKSGGNRISPLEIEEVVYQVPGISECAAVGIPDELFGEVVKLFVVTDSMTETLEKDITIFCKQNLASFKVPKQIEFVATLPKTASGKIKRSKLKVI